MIDLKEIGKKGGKMTIKSFDEPVINDVGGKSDILIAYPIIRPGEGEREENLLLWRAINYTRERGVCVPDANLWWL